MNFFIQHKDQILQILLISTVFVLFYFFSIRPQKKKYNQQKEFLDKLKPGIKIITMGGIHGIVLDINPTSITIQINKNGSTMVIEKNSISIESTLKLNQ